MEADAGQPAVAGGEEVGEAAEVGAAERIKKLRKKLHWMQYKNTEGGKLKIKEGIKKYRQTDKGKAANAAASARYRAGRKANGRSPRGPADEERRLQAAAAAAAAAAAEAEAAPAVAVAVNAQEAMEE